MLRPAGVELVVGRSASAKPGQRVNQVQRGKLPDRTTKALTLGRGKRTVKPPFGLVGHAVMPQLVADGIAPRIVVNAGKPEPSVVSRIVGAEHVAGQFQQQHRLGEDFGIVVDCWHDFWFEVTRFNETILLTPLGGVARGPPRRRTREAGVPTLALPARRRFPIALAR